MTVHTPASRVTGLVDTIAGLFRPNGEAGKAGTAAEATRFVANGALTLGVELELQIVDRTNFELAPRAQDLLGALGTNVCVKPELYLDMIELNTGICADANAAAADLGQTLDRLTAAGEALGVAFASAGTHPTSSYADSVVHPAERYAMLIDRNQWLTRRWRVYGLHVHVGMESGDDCIRFNNFFLRLLPHLLALSASAPYWQGVDTGLATCRPTIYEALPTAGLPYFVADWAEFTALTDTLRRAGAITSLKDLWWDVRPSPGFGTLEIRVCDSPATLAETAAIVAFIHLLAHWFRDHGDWLAQVPQPPHWMMRENKWRVIRHGLDASLAANAAGDNKPVREEILAWLDKCGPYVETLGYHTQAQTIRDICARGGSYARQRAAFAAKGTLGAVTAWNLAEFHARKPDWSGMTDGG